MPDGARPWGMDVGARIGAGDSPEVFCRSKPIFYKGFIVIVLHAIHCASDQVSGDSRLETESRQRGGCAPGVSRRVWGRIFGCQRPCGDLALAGRLREANAGDPFLPDVRVARRRPGFGCPAGVGGLFSCGAGKCEMRHRRRGGARLAVRRFEAAQTSRPTAICSSGGAPAGGAATCSRSTRAGGTALKVAGAFMGLYFLDGDFTGLIARSEMAAPPLWPLILP